MEKFEQWAYLKYVFEDVLYPAVVVVSEETEVYGVEDNEVKKTIYDWEVNVRREINDNLYSDILNSSEIRYIEKKLREKGFELKSWFVDFVDGKAEYVFRIVEKKDKVRVEFEIESENIKVISAKGIKMYKNVKGIGKKMDEFEEMVGEKVIREKVGFTGDGNIIAYDVEMKYEDIIDVIEKIMGSD